MTFKDSTFGPDDGRFKHVSSKKLFAQVLEAKAGSKNAPGDAVKSVLGIEKDKADTAKLGETLRKYELPQPTEPAFVFQPLPAARGRR